MLAGGQLNSKKPVQLRANYVNKSTKLEKPPDINRTTINATDLNIFIVSLIVIEAIP